MDPKELPASGTPTAEDQADAMATVAKPELYGPTSAKPLVTMYAISFVLVGVFMAFAGAAIHTRATDVTVALIVVTLLQWAMLTLATGFAARFSRYRGWYIDVAIINFLFNPGWVLALLLL